MSGLNITAARARAIADAIDAYDADIKVLQDGKRETFGEVRADLEALGLDKTNIRDEMAALKAAIVKRAKRRIDADAADERDALTDSYLDLIERSAPRAMHAIATSVPTYPERVSRPAVAPAKEQDPSAGDTGSSVRAAAPEFPEPDATPAGAVVAIRSGVTAGETAPSFQVAIGDGLPAGESGANASKGVTGGERPAAISGLAEANAIAARPRSKTDDTSDLPAALLLKTQPLAIGEQA